MTVSISHEAKLRNLTIRGWGAWNTEFGMIGFTGSRASGLTDYMKRGIGNMKIIEVEVCLYYTELCKGNKIQETIYELRDEA